LAAMVARANEADSRIDPVARAVRGRRMLMAIYRGFCVMNCWSPLNIMTAVVSTAVPAAPLGRLLPIAFVVAIGMAALGWLEDRLLAGPGGLSARPFAAAERSVVDPFRYHCVGRRRHVAGGGALPWAGHRAGDGGDRCGADGGDDLDHRAASPET